MPQHRIFEKAIHFGSPSVVLGLLAVVNLAVVRHQVNVVDKRVQRLVGVVVHGIACVRVSFYLGVRTRRFPRGGEGARDERRRRKRKTRRAPIEGTHRGHNLR